MESYMWDSITCTENMYFGKTVTRSYYINDEACVHPPCHREQQHSSRSVRTVSSRHWLAAPRIQLSLRLHASV